MTVQSTTRPSSPKRSASSKQAKSDSFYGHEDTAKMCARFITALFSCPDVPPPPASGPPPTTPPPSLAPFIAYALHRTRLNASVTFCALFLLSRLKGRFPAARGSSGHRLFISAFMIASKVICDDTYSNKSWCVVGQGMFSLREINQMEREMCSYLEWVLNVKPEELADFEAEVKRDYGVGGVKATTVSSPLASTTGASPVRATSSVAPVVPATQPLARTASVSVNVPGYSPDSTPPSPSHSDGSSPTSSEPRTPPTPDVPAGPANVRSQASMRAKVAAANATAAPGKPVAVAPTVHVKVPEERVPGGARSQAFAFATPSEW